MLRHREDSCLGEARENVGITGAPDTEQVSVSCLLEAARKHPTWGRLCMSMACGVSPRFRAGDTSHYPGGSESSAWAVSVCLWVNSLLFASAVLPANGSSLLIGCFLFLVAQLTIQHG